MIIYVSSFPTEYLESSNFGVVWKWGNIATTCTFVISLVITMGCVFLFGIAICVSDPDVLPTERSDTSNKIAVVMKLASGFLFLLLVVVLVGT